MNRIIYVKKCRYCPYCRKVSEHGPMSWECLVTEGLEGYGVPPQEIPAECHLRRYRVNVFLDPDAKENKSDENV